MLFWITRLRSKFELGDSTEYPPISRTPPWRWNACPGTMLCQRLRIHSMMANFSRAGEKQQAALCSCGFLTSLCSPAPTARPFITNPPPHPRCRSHPVNSLVHLLVLWEVVYSFTKPMSAFWRIPLQKETSKDLPVRFWATRTTHTYSTCVQAGALVTGGRSDLIHICFPLDLEAEREKGKKEKSSPVQKIPKQTTGRNLHLGNHRAILESSSIQPWGQRAECHGAAKEAVKT